MATYVKLRGLDRGRSAVSDGSATGGSYRGWRVKSALGPSVTGGTSVRAALTIGAGNAAVTYSSKIGGANGNNIRVAHVVAGTVPRSIAVTYPTAGSPYPTITVTAAATAGVANGTETATAIAAAVNADPEASQFVTATAGGTGGSVITAAAAANLASGANGTGTAEPFYQNVNNKNTAIVDVDDPSTARNLGRNKNRFVSLGQQ